MKGISRWSFTLFKWLIVIAALSWLVTRLDLLWPCAIEVTYQQLGDDPYLESRLTHYSDLGLTAKQVLDFTTPGSGTIDSIIKSVNDTGSRKLLIRVLERVSPTAAAGYMLLEVIVEKATDLKVNCQDLQQLNLVAATSKAFRSNRQQTELRTLADHCSGPGVEALSTLKPDLDNLSDAVHSLDEHFSEFLEGLSKAQESGGIVKKPAELLHQALQPLRQPLLELDTRLQLAKENALKDIDTLRSIHHRVVIVSRIDEVLKKIPSLPEFRYMARAIWSHLHLGLYLAAALLVSGIGFHAGDWYEHHRANRESPKARAIMQPPATMSMPTMPRVTLPRKPQPRSRSLLSALLSYAQPSPQITARSASSARLSGWLIRRTSQTSDRLISLPSQGKITIGSRRSNEVRIRGTAVSAHHTAVCVARTCYFIRDLQSVSGTFVNGEAITKDRRLRNGDRIVVGDVEFVFISVFAPSWKNT